LPDNLPYDEKELLLRIAEGDEQAFKSLHDLYWGKLYSVTLSVVKSPDIAMDVLQEVFIKFWHKRVTLKDVDNIKSYIFISTRNEIISQLRKQDRRSTHYNRYGQHLKMYLEQADNKLVLDETTRIIASAIDRLPAQQRQILKLSRIEGLSHSEIARQLNIEKKSVTNAITRALNNIRSYLHQVEQTGLYIGCWCLFELFQ
jgi:RNA polymerase sigma-70 factor (family 1)